MQGTLAELIGNISSKLVPKPNFYVRDYVQTAKIELLSRKNYQLIITNKFFEIVTIPTVNSPKYSLIDVEKDEINQKFCEKNLLWLETKLIMMKMGNNEFTLHLISTALMEYFPKTLWPVSEVL